MSHYIRFILHAALSGGLEISTLVVVFNWISECLQKDHAGTLHSFVQLVNSVREQFVLFSGLGLCDMWKAFFYRDLKVAGSSTVERLLKFAALGRLANDRKSKLGEQKLIFSRLF